MNSILDSLDDQLIASLNKLPVSSGKTLFHQGDVGNSMYILYEGRLEAKVRQANGSELKVGEISQGEPVGEIQLLTGGRRTASVVAITDSVLLELPASRMNEISVQFPDSYKILRQKILQRLRRNQLMILLPTLMEDFNESQLQELEAHFEWIRLKKGNLLLRQGDPGDSMFIVVSGRLNVIQENPDGTRNTLLEISRGETVGELSFFTNRYRSASVFAVRDSVLVKLSHAVFYKMIARNPSFHNHLTKGIARRLQSSSFPQKPTSPATNIALIPLDDHPSVQGCIKGLVRAMGSHGASLYLNSEQVAKRLNFDSSETSFSASNTLRVSTWLDEQERKYRYVFLEADSQMTSWTRKTIQQADRIVFVANASSRSELRGLEIEISREAGSIQKTLFLLHPGRSSIPSSTVKWLQKRHLKHHFHIRTDSPVDIERVARHLSGKSIALVLGGGGFRGFAHIGVIRALQESNIPIDRVGGSSMGAMISAHVALSRSSDDIYRRIKTAFLEERNRDQSISPFLSSQNKLVNNVTYQKMYHDHYIEDLWLPCFFVSSSLNTSEVVVHDSGKIWNLLRASNTMPGLHPAVPIKNDLLVDGGVLNNVPVDSMRKRCSGKIIAVDVTSPEDTQFANTHPSNLLDLAKERNRTPSNQTDYSALFEVLMRSLLLGSRHSTKVARNNADVYLAPPVTSFDFLDISQMDALIESGYITTKDYLTTGALHQELGL